MKQSDVISIILIGVIGFIVSYFLIDMVFDPESEVVTFKTIDTISGNVDSPNESVFNVNAINPTVEVFIGNCSDYDENHDGILSDEERAKCKEFGEK